MNEDLQTLGGVILPGLPVIIPGSRRDTGEMHGPTRSEAAVSKMDVSKFDEFSPLKMVQSKMKAMYACMAGTY